MATVPVNVMPDCSGVNPHVVDVQVGDTIRWNKAGDEIEVIVDPTVVNITTANPGGPVEGVALKTALIKYDVKCSDGTVIDPWVLVEPGPVLRGPLDDFLRENIEEINRRLNAG